MPSRRGRVPCPDLRVEPVECLSVCKRPCTVAVASADRWTYVYGDMDPAASAETILAGLARLCGDARTASCPGASGRRRSAPA